MVGPKMVRATLRPRCTTGTAGKDCTQRSSQSRIQQLHTLHPWRRWVKTDVDQERTGSQGLRSGATSPFKAIRRRRTPGLRRRIQFLGIPQPSSPKQF